MATFRDFKKLDDKIIFNKVVDCLKQVTKKVPNTNIIIVLLALEKTKSYKGLREWFNNLGKKYHQFASVTFVPKSRDEAESLLDEFTTLLYGVRSGESLLGLRTQSKSAVIKLYDGNVPPSHQALDSLRYYDDLWIRFLNKMGNIQFFSELSNFEKELYLEMYQSPQDIYFEDVPNLKLHILDIGDSTERGLPQLPEDIIEKITDLNKPPLLIKDVAGEFPAKPGSSGIKGRHTLIFRRGLWKINISYKQVNTYTGIVIDPHNGIYESAEKVLPGNEDSMNLVLFNVPAAYNLEKGKYVVSKKQEVCICVYTSYVAYSDETFIEIINDSFEELNLEYKVSKDDFTYFKNYFKTYNFTPAGYKSLLQKILRFSPSENVVWKSGLESIENTSTFNFDAVIVLVCTIAMLFMSPGSFVPDIQRFVSGTESAFKRVIVSIFEDSWFNENVENRVYTCMVGAFLSQRLPGWRPTEYMLRCVFTLAIDAYFSKKAFVWDIKKGMKQLPYTINPNSKNLEVASALLDEVKSFQGDLGLTRDVVKNFYENTLKTTKNETGKMPKTMVVEHCIDQHWSPEIAYFFNMNTLAKNIEKGNSPFSKLFIRIFSEVTGINTSRPPRKGITMNVGGYDENFENREFVKETRMAQKLILVSKDIHQPSSTYISATTMSSTRKSTFSLKYSFGIEWIAGMVGALEIKGTKKGPAALVTLNPSNPEILVAIRKPSRDMKDPFLSDERSEEAISTAKKLLEQGILIKENYPLLELKKSILKINFSSEDDEGKFSFKLNEDNTFVDYKNIFEGSFEIPYIDDVELSLLNFLTHHSKGIVVDFDKKLFEILKNTDLKYIRKLVTYFTNKNIIEFKRLGRDGGGTKGIVNIDDVGAYQLFTKIYLMFPFCFIRKKSNALDFLVVSKPGVLYIKELILKFLFKEQSNSSISKKYGNVKDSKNRVLWEHQIEAIDELKINYNNGRKGSFLWLPVGSGKTMIVLEYLKYKIENGSIPPYIIYTLPSSAIESIINEIKFYGLAFKLLVPIKNVDKSKNYIKKGCVPDPYTINLIEHDHLRKCEDVLPEYIGDGIFIMDEVHKALNNTKRTAVALQLSHLSREFIALTGTPIIDSNTYKLVWWLEQIVPFEVNINNFWVAANDMISKKFNTGVNVHHISEYIPMNATEEKIYKNLVPIGLGGNNNHASANDFRKAMEMCYMVTNRGILENVKKYLLEGRGVFVVAKDMEHQTTLKDLFIKNIKGISPKDIFLITKTDSLFLTDDTVAKKQTPDYKIVITTVRKSAGYTLTRLSAMITGVYPSNDATRTQLEGRIDRISQNSKDIDIVTVHTGILTYIMQKHIDARNLSMILSTLADIF